MPNEGEGNNAGHTPGPWAWFVNTKTNLVYLGTPDRGRLFVMGFKRWGMQYAQPQFRSADCILQDLPELVEVDHNGEAWEINHPDARLIAAAPDLLAALEDCIEAIDRRSRADAPFRATCLQQALTAIAKAEGGAE